MKLQAAIDSYVSLKQSLGASFRSEARILRSFARAMGDIELGDVHPAQCEAFWRGSGDPTRFWERKYYTLRGLFAFLVGRGHLPKSPLREPGPKIPRSFQPHIYSHDELKRLVDETDSLDDPRSPLQAQTFRCLLLVLYGAGLRASEALRLRCCDVDLRSGLLTIWDSKFFKSRLVPIGAQLQTALAAYDRQRRALLAFPRGEESAFFATCTGYRVSLSRLEKTFVLLRARARVARPPTDRWQPRLHDLRHTFAVDTMVRWYREGADVQRCLPLLSTYLGHANVSGTQTYLTMTPALLSEASRRFESYAQPTGGGDG